MISRDKLAIPLRDAADAVGLSHWTLRKLISEGRLAAIRINRKVLVAPAELERLVATGKK